MNALTVAIAVSSTMFTRPISVAPPKMVPLDTNSLLAVLFSRSPTLLLSLAHTPIPPNTRYRNATAIIETKNAATEADRSLLAGLPRGLDALSKAHRIQEKVSGVGFDWADARGAFDKVAEELEEVRVALEDEPSPALEEELGDLLFAVVNLTRLAGSHSMGALARANQKFTRRFEALERLARERGIELGKVPLAELDRLWDEVKAGEKK